MKLWQGKGSPPKHAPRSKIAQAVRDLSVNELLELCAQACHELAYFELPDGRNLLLRRANLYRSTARMLREISTDAVAISRSERWIAKRKKGSRK